MDYVALALSRLTNQFSEKPLIRGLVEAIIAPIQTLEDSTQEIKTKRWIDTAEGKQLDGAGYIVGEMRLGRNDDDYREAIRFRIFVNTSNATPQDLIRGLRFLTKPDNVQYIEQYPATAMLFTDGGASPFSVENEQFGTGNGLTNQFQLSYEGKTVKSVSSADIFRTDWRGRVELTQEARTNLLTYSEEFDNAAWSKAGLSVTANAIAAPDGSMTADKIIVSNTVTAAWMAQLRSIDVNTPYTFSAYYKQGERHLVRHNIFSDGTPDWAVEVDLRNGSVTAIHPGISSHSVTPVGDGWYRVSMIFQTGDATNSQVQPGRQHVTGDGTSGLYAWGAKLEQGSAPTSYIKTTNTQKTITDYEIEDGLVTLAETPELGATLEWSGSGGFAIAGGKIHDVMQSLSPAAISDVPVMVSYSRKDPLRFGRESPPSELFVNMDADYLTANGDDIQVQITQATQGATLGGIALADLDVGGFMLDVGGPTLAIDSPNYNTVLESGYHLTGVYQ